MLLSRSLHGDKVAELSDHASLETTHDTYMSESGTLIVSQFEGLVPLTPLVVLK